MTRKRRRTPRITADDGMAWWNLYRHRTPETLEPTLDFDLDGMAEVYRRDRRRFVARYRAQLERLGMGATDAAAVAFFEVDDLELRAEAEAALFARDRYWRERWAAIDWHAENA